MPNGKAAADAAAAGIVRGAASVPIKQILPLANAAVLDTGGGTTAVVVVVSAAKGRAAHILSAGDSSLFMLDKAGQVQSVAPKDAGVGHQIRDYLGHLAMSGHVTRLTVAPGATFVLCSDGVDRVVGADGVAALLAASVEDIPSQLEALMDAVRAGGAPDNATVVVVRRDV